MNILLRTTGIMSDYLPEGAVGGRVELELPAGATFAQLVARLEIPESERYIVSINDTLLPEPLEHLLQEGDQVIIMAPLTAG